MVGRASEIASPEFATALATKNLSRRNPPYRRVDRHKVRVIAKLCESEKGGDLFNAAGVPLGEIRCRGLGACGAGSEKLRPLRVTATDEKIYKTVAVLLL